MSVARLIVSLAFACALGAWSLAPAQEKPSDSHSHEAHDHDGHNHAEDGDAHSASSGDPLSIDPDLALWTLVVFLILLAVLKKFAWGPILSALERREDAIAEHISQAERSHEEAKRLLAQYEARLASAATEVRGILDEARKDAEHTKQSILAEAKTGAEAERDRALRDIETATDSAMEQLARKSADLAVDLAGKILKTKITGDEHAKLIQDAMSKFPASASSN